MKDLNTDLIIACHVLLLKKTMFEKSNAKITLWSTRYTLWRNAMSTVMMTTT